MDSADHLIGLHTSQNYNNMTDNLKIQKDSAGRKKVYYLFCLRGRNYENIVSLVFSIHVNSNPYIQKIYTCQKKVENFMSTSDTTYIHNQYTAC